MLPSVIGINPEIIEHLSDQFYDSKYDIKKLMTEIFTSKWFYNEENIGAKIKSPIELMAGIMRTLPMELEKPENLIVYQKLLGQYHIIPSMTESYDPYANAVAERINGILKQEFLLEELNLPLSDMKQVIRDAVYKYNNIRPHYSCGYKTPEYMHHQKLIKIKSYKNKQFSKTDLAEL